MKFFKKSICQRRIDRLNSTYVCDLFSRMLFVYIVVFGALSIDTFCINTLLNKVLNNENSIAILGMSLCAAFALNLPLAVVGSKLKEYRQGLCQRSDCILLMSAAIALFLLVFIINFIFRIDIRDVAFEFNLDEGKFNSFGKAVPQPSSDKDLFIIPAVFVGMLPLFSSLASFVISYNAYNPLQNKIKALKASIIHLDNDISGLRAAIAEAENKQDHCKTLLAREQDLFISHTNIITAVAEQLRQKARIAVMERINGSPEEISVITDSAKASVNSMELDNCVNTLWENLNNKFDTSTEN